MERSLSVAKSLEEGFTPELRREYHRLMDKGEEALIEWLEAQDDEAEKATWGVPTFEEGNEEEIDPDGDAADDFLEVRGEKTLESEDADTPEYAVDMLEVLVEALYNCEEESEENPP
jgi:DNA-binding PadR family transcriptional regulator